MGKFKRIQRFANFKIKSFHFFFFLYFWLSCFIFTQRKNIFPSFVAQPSKWIHKALLFASHKKSLIQSSHLKLMDAQGVSDLLLSRQFPWNPPCSLWHPHVTKNLLTVAQLKHWETQMSLWRKLRETGALSFGDAKPAMIPSSLSQESWLW